MPPHITVRSPFKPAGSIDAQVLNTLEAICAAFPQFAFTLARTNRFTDPGVLYLMPEPVDPFITLHRHIQTHFPVNPQDDPVMHLTLAGWHPTELDQIEAEFYREYGDRLPVGARATKICLFEQRENQWVKLSNFPFAKSREE